MIDAGSLDSSLAGNYNCRLEASMVMTDHTGAVTGNSTPVEAPFELKVKPCQVSSIDFDQADN